MSQPKAESAEVSSKRLQPLFNLFCFASPGLTVDPCPLQLVLFPSLFSEERTYGLLCLPKQWMELSTWELA